MLQYVSKPEIPALIGAVGFAINILQVPVVVQEGVVELLEVELLLVTRASAPAVAVLSLLLVSQDISVKQVMIPIIPIVIRKEFGKFFNIRK